MTQAFGDKQVIIITGGFGRKKSEYAINLSLDLVAQVPITLIDLALVNAYFRSLDARQVPETHGVKKLTA